MPKINIIKRKLINAPVEKVYETLSHMSTWQTWSPWLIMDPDTKVDVSTDDKSYSWSGKRTGEGHMEITHESKNKSINYDLTFLKPWKSEAKVKFTTTPKEGGTEVAWHMDSSLPWFMFWMKKMMTAFVGNDYERGLNLLKNYVEDGKVHSELNWIGESQYPGCNYLGIRRTCSIAEMPKLMETDFIKLMVYARSTDSADISGTFNQYHKFDFVKQIVDYTAGVPFKNIPDDAPSEFLRGSLAPTKLYTLEHKGPYEHLGNAWTTMYTMHRNKEINIKKGYHPFETYGNSPKDTDPKNLITYINFALK
ncbi:MAG: putative transcriptional regulator YdeE/uncharacterized protein YndB with AHSA1/START domain [Saprospiraceae bacterium]|jgi:predicted transcriptional regulator YdeE/uncharacterized protein YndB with AHSA1/START domain